MTTVIPTPTPAAIKNCGLAIKLNKPGEAVLKAAVAEGPILVTRLLISANVRATAAMAFGFFCKC